jgi:hypothetical protein
MVIKSIKVINGAAIGVFTWFFDHTNISNFGSDFFTAVGANCIFINLSESKTIFLWWFLLIVIGW